MAIRTTDVAMNLTLEARPDTVTATVTLDGLGPSMTATGEARRSSRDPDPHIELGLAVSRALIRLEHRIMGGIHERIDRSTTDDI